VFKLSSIAVQDLTRDQVDSVNVGVPLMPNRVAYIKTYQMHAQSQVPGMSHSQQSWYDAGRYYNAPMRQVREHRQVIKLGKQLYDNSQFVGVYYTGQYTQWLDGKDAFYLRHELHH
jgi:hypothetical protein